jgi:hypothetical protein
MLPAHSREKVPAISVAVWLVTTHWKLPHDDALGTVRFCDAHVPRSPDVGPLAPPPPPVSGATGVGAVLLWCWNPQALDSMSAAASATASQGVGIFIIDSYRVVVCGR